MKKPAQTSTIITAFTTLLHRAVSAAGLVPRWIQLPCLLLMLTSLSGCAVYPLGMSKEQWEALPAAQQSEYQARQANIDAERYRIAETARLHREQEERDQQENEREQLAALYQQARYGDIVTVNIQGGMVAFHGKRFPYEPISFDLIRGETKLVEIARQGQSYTTTLIEMRFSEDGNTFYFDAPARNRFIALNDGWDYGRQYRPPEIGSHDGHSEAIGINIGIKFRALPGISRSYLPKPANRTENRRH